MEIIFISRDRDENSFREYFGQMSFDAVPYDPEVLNRIAGHYQVRGIPTLTLVDKEGRVLKPNARGEVTQIGPSVVNQWKGLCH